VAYSGRCLLSGYFNHRDANQGTCTNSCRWDFKVHDAATGPEGDVVLIEERERRAGSYMPVEEDEHGTYILNSKDLRAIEHVHRLCEIGVDSLKIEGRTKSPYYAARATQAYRQAIDDAQAGRALDPRLLGDLEGLANRGYTGGFFERHPDRDYQNYLRGHSESARSQYVGDVLGYGPDGLAEIEVKNRFAVGDRLELIHPGGNQEIALDDMRDKDGRPITVAPGSGHRVRIPLPPHLDGAYLARFH
jgi:putative protease